MANYIQPGFGNPAPNPQISVGLVPGRRFQDGELPAGSINGLNSVFTLAFPPIPTGSLCLYLNGVLQTQNSDYTLSANVVTFVSAPAAGGILIAWYRY